MKYILLAGGSGERLWPWSCKSHPKQFLSLGGEESLLQKTASRFPSADSVIVVPQAYLHLVHEQLPHFEGQILIEPERRGTAHAIRLAAQSAPHDCLLVCPCDHYLEPIETLLALLPIAERLAKRGHHILFGIQPTHFETGYGYIEQGEPYAEGAFHVKRFVEKPRVEVADALWNSGLFLFHSPTLLQELPSDLPDTSIDYALLEHSHRSLVLPLSLSWSDVGSWDSVYNLLDKDSSDNVVRGRVVAKGCKNCLILGHQRPISALGLEDLLIVETADALFIGKKGSSQQVKEVVQELTTSRPWGHFTILETGKGYKIKRIVVEPLESLSLQYHRHRSEHWVVVKGRATIRLGDEERVLQENESLYVAPLQVHRLRNRETTPLEVIEVQVGGYLEEDDIVRLEDSYQR